MRIARQHVRIGVSALAAGLLASLIGFTAPELATAAVTPAVAPAVSAAAATTQAPATVAAKAAKKKKKKKAKKAKKRAGETTFETGKVTMMGDGDTFVVATKAGKKKVRLAAVQATETGTCGGAQATAAMKKLVFKKKVQLRGLKSGSRAEGRLLRTVYVKRGGAWVDVQAELIRLGLGIAKNSPPENLHSAEYTLLMQQQMAAGTGLWNRSFCGQSAAGDFSMWVRWDADGVDQQNINDEYVVIRNNSNHAVDISGWIVRDNSHKQMAFPGGSVIAAGDEAIVHAGSGTQRGKHYYWGSGTVLFRNLDSEAAGDTALLEDRNGSPRAWFVYPCKVNCTSPALTNHVRIESTQPAGENPSNETVVVAADGYVALRGLYLNTRGRSFDFPAGATVDVGRPLVVHMGPGTNSGQHVYWNFDQEVLWDDYSTPIRIGDWNGIHITDSQGR